MTSRLNQSLLFIIPILGIMAFLLNLKLPAIDLYITNLTVTDNKLNLLSLLPIMLFWRNYPDENIYKVILLSLVMYFADLGLLTFLPIITVLLLDKDQSPVINFGNILIFVLANIFKLFDLVWVGDAILITSVLLILLNVFLYKEKDYYFYYQLFIYISIMKFIEVKQSWIAIVVPCLVLGFLAIFWSQDSTKKYKKDEIVIGAFIFLLLPKEYINPGLFFSFIMFTNYKEFKDDKVDHSLSSLITFFFIVLFLSFAMKLSIYVFIMLLTYLLIKSEEIIAKIKSLSIDLLVIANITILLLMCFINYWNIR
jgi:hypothetical protein